MMPLDRDLIQKALTRLDVPSDAHGLIPQFGVYMTRAPAQLYTRLSYEFERAFGSRFHPESSRMLINCGHVCAYNTLHAIEQSKEWKALIAPVLQTPLDRIEAGMEICAALGWCSMTVTDVSERGALFTVTTGYEADMYQRDYGPADHPICYKLAGVTAALMDLAFGRPFPHGLYAYQSQEITCRAHGSETCTFIAGRILPHTEGNLR